MNQKLALIALAIAGVITVGYFVLPKIQTSQTNEETSFRHDRESGSDDSKSNKETIVAEGAIVEDKAPTLVQEANFRSPNAPASHSSKSGRLAITGIRSRQGQNYFSIQVDCREEGKYRCPIIGATAANYIEVQPSVRFRVVAGKRGLTLVGAFEPATDYEFTFYPGLESKDYYLPTLARRRHSTPDFSSTVRFQVNSRYLPRHAGFELPFESRNVEEFDLKVSKIHSQNTVFWLTGRGEAPSNRVSDVVLEKSVKITSQDNKLFKGKLDLSELGKLGKGLYAIEASKEEKSGRSTWTKRLANTTVAITNIAAVAKMDKNEVHVWTKSLADASASTGVNVSLYSYSNKLIGQCKTQGSDAHCTLPLDDDETIPYAILLESKDDMSYLRFEDLKTNDPSADAGSRSYVEQDKPIDAFIYSSRGVYRPGETINLAAIARTRDFSPVRETALTWILRDPRDKKIREAVRKTDKQGMLSFDIPLSFQAQTGNYRVELRTDKTIASYNLLVEEFAPERIAVKVDADESSDLESSAKFNADAKYLFGPPVSKGDYVFSCSLTPAWRRVPGRSEFHIGLVDDAGQLTSFAPDSSRGQLDGNGTVQETCDYRSVAETFPTVMLVSGRFDVSESGSGRVSSKVAQTLASKSSAILGVRPVDSSSSRVAVELKLFDLKGNEVKEDTSVQLEWYRTENNWYYSYDPNSGYSRWNRSKIRVLEGRKSVELKGGQASFEFGPGRSYGSYIVRATDTKTKFTSELESYVGYSWYWAGPNSRGLAKPGRPDRIELRSSSETVKPGDSIELQFESPFTGQMLLSVESDRLHSATWHDVKKGSITKKVSIPEAGPNVYITALILKQPEEGKMWVPARAQGSLSLQMNRESKQQDIEIVAADEVRPNHSLDIELSAAPDTSLTVSIVDEGILQLTDFKTPNALDHFLAPRRLEVGTFETFGWTQPANLGSHLPGGGGPGGRDHAPSIPVKLVSHWSGLIQTDKDGRARVTMPVPPFQGKLRVMAVSSSQQKTGSQQKLITVRDPLVVQPTFPRFLITGDEFVIPVHLSNLTGKAQTVSSAISSTGAKIDFKSPKAETKLADGESKTLFFRGKVKGFSGEVSFRVDAKGQGISSFDEQTIPIAPSTPRINDTRVVSAESPIDVPKILSDNIREDSLRIETGITSLQYVKELSHLTNLIRYPYGCLEQTVSSTFPLLVMKDLLPLIAPDIKEDSDLPKMVQSGINRLLGMQADSGGFLYWPGGRDAHPWGTAYASHMLLVAKEFGYAVPERELQNALAYLKKALNGDYKHVSYYSKSWDAYALYVLSVAGDHQTAQLRQVALRPRDWGSDRLEAQFLIMAALRNAGERKLASTFDATKDLFAPAEFKTRDSYFTFSSAMRTDAIRLATAERLWPGGQRQDLLAKKIAARLSSNAYHNTQETAWSLIGLARRAKEFKRASVSDISLRIDDKAINPTITRGDNPVWQFDTLHQLSKPLEFDYKKEGELDPKAFVRIDGYLKATPKTPASSSSLLLKRKYFTTTGEEVDLKSIPIGSVVVVELELINRREDLIENIAAVDRLPAGFEIENPRLGRKQILPWIDQKTIFEPDHIDMRDQELRIFGNLGNRNQKKKFYYYFARAVSEGHFTIPAAKIEAMYEPEVVFFSQVNNANIVRETE